MNYVLGLLIITSFIFWILSYYLIKRQFTKSIPEELKPFFKWDLFDAGMCSLVSSLNLIMLYETALLIYLVVI